MLPQLKIDHIALCTHRIKQWAYYFIVKMGGTLTLRKDDTDHESTTSSMMLWTIDFGSFSIALTQGIDRQEESQVTTFVKTHGDLVVQHVAFSVENLDAFRKYAEQEGFKFRGDTLVRREGSGLVKQVFTKGCEQGNAGAVSFFEFVERQKKADITFSPRFGLDFYRQIERAQEIGDTEPFTDFSDMPPDWEPPPVEEEKG